MKHYLIFLSLLPFLFSCSQTAQGEQGEQSLELDQATAAMSKQVELPAGTQLTLAFYNVENLFDTRDDPQTEDGDFLPEGRYNWTEEKLQVKLTNLAKVIGQLGENGPDFLGVAEVENREMLERLSRHELIRNRGYKIAHDESPDERGIDVGFLYDPEKMSLLGMEALEVRKAGDPGFRTREILMVKGQINGETIYFFVNHWPSRREGQMESEPKRMAAAQTLRNKVNQILQEEQDVAFVLMGDFNDDPNNRSLTEILASSGQPTGLAEDQLFNPMASIFDPNSMGSLTYQGKWNLFDQILLSEDLLDGEHALSYLPNSVKVYNEEMVRVPNRRTKFVPRRAIFRGNFQSNGYSDHFPVYLKLYIN